jgi:alpha-galactosidase/6-phospho-beta-glucosidase family protein
VHPARDGEIVLYDYLYDYDEARANAMAAFLRKIPEASGSGLRVAVERSLDDAVEGADFVEITACPWSYRYYDNCQVAAHRNGFISSDNVSLPGAFLAVKSAGLAMAVARAMEKSAPDATLICRGGPRPFCRRPGTGLAAVDGAGGGASRLRGRRLHCDVSETVR